LRDASKETRCSSINNNNCKHPVKTQTGHLIRVNEVDLALFRYKDGVYAVNEKCPHAGGPLHLGDIEELADLTLCIRCPWHSWKYDLQTGKLLLPENRNLQATVYPVKVDTHGRIFVGFKKIAETYFTSDQF